MHVLYIHQYFTTRDGVGGTRSYEFARRMVANGHMVTMITGPQGIAHLPEVKGGGLVARFRVDGIDVISINVGYSNYMRLQRRVYSFFKFMAVSAAEAVRVKGVDVVFASTTPLTVGITGRIAQVRHRAPFVFEVRDLWPEYIEDFGISKSRLLLGGMRVLATYLYRKAKHIVVISDPMKARLESLYPFTKGKVTTIPLGSDVETAQEWEECPLPEEARGRFLVAYTGQLGYVGGFYRLMHVAARLKDEGVSFVVAGDGKMRPYLEDLKKELSLDHVHFIGRIPKKQVFGLIRQADLCAITHIFKDEKTGRVFINCTDSLTNKFFDYLAAGRPIIINHDCESAKVMEKHGCGVRIPFDDYDGAAREILRLKESPELLRRMGENGRRLAAEVFDRRKLADRCEGLLTSMLKPGYGSA